MNTPSKPTPLGVYLILPSIVVAILGIVFGIEWLFDLNLSQFGLHPRDIDHWYGIFTFFFLHGSFEHLANNSIAILVLLSFTRYYFPSLFLRVLLISIIAPAILTFFIANDSIHIGASGSVYFLVVFLFVSSIFRTNRYFLALSLLLVFLYGGLWWWVFPIEEGISFEGHLAGAISGFVTAVIYRKAPFSSEVVEPKPKFETDENAPDIIGDQWKTHYQIDIKYTYTDHENTDHYSANPPSDDERSGVPRTDEHGGRGD